MTSYRLEIVREIRFSLETLLGLVLSVAMFVVLLTVSFPIGSDVTVWYFGTSAFVLIAVLALSLYGTRMALAGQPLFKDD